MKLTRLSIVILLLLQPIVTFATVDFLSVNRITKEYYWGDEDSSTGWIGWTNVTEGQIDTTEDDLKKLGYTETKYPYKIELVTVSIIVLILMLQFIVKKIKKNRSHYKLS